MSWMDDAEVMSSAAEELLALLWRMEREDYTPTWEEENALLQVEVLDIYVMRLEALPQSIGKLRNLQQLYVSENQLQSLAGIEKLTNLKALYVTDNQLQSLHGIESLSKLQRLDVSGNQLQSLAGAGIEKLTNLKELVVRRNQLQSLRGIENLTKLETLDVAGNQLQSLAGAGIEKLTNLKTLYVGYNPLTSLPDTWFEPEGFALKNLEHLSLRGLSLRRLPPAVMALNLDFRFAPAPLLNGIDLYETTLATQPISLFHQPRELIQAYFDAEKIPVSEGKVIFLGHGDVGKTYTIARMKNNGKKQHYDTSMTPGIDISGYPATYDGKNFNISFWDFGGQETMHAMHRCFLTQRTCYVVMVSNRLPDPNGQARHWLRYIDSFAPGSKVLLVVNRWENYPYDGNIDLTQLRADYPNLVDLVVISAKCDEQEDFQEKLTGAIVKMAAELDSIGMEFPVQWNNIRQELLKLADSGTHHIDQNQYHKICADNGLNDPDIRMWLLEWFNDLGTCFSYHQDTDKKELAEYQVLTPRWLTNAIYLLILEGRNETKTGVISLDKVQKTLKKYINSGTLPGATYDEKKQECTYILQVMRKFHLSFPVSDTEEFIPALCSNVTPDGLVPANYKDHLRYELEYTFLPDSVIQQLMVALFPKLNLTFCWKRGMMLSDNGLSAVVRIDSDRPILRIDIYSDGEAYSTEIWKLLNRLLQQLNEINTRLNLTPEEFVFVEENGTQERFSMQRILNIHAGIENRQTRSFVQGNNRDYPIDPILERVYGPKNVEQAQADLPKERREGVTTQVMTKYIFNNCEIGSVGDGITVHHHHGLSQEQQDKVLDKIYEQQDKVLDKIYEQQDKVLDKIYEQQDKVLDKIYEQQDKVLEKINELRESDLLIFADILAEQQDKSVQALGLAMKNAKTKRSISDVLSDGANIATLGSILGPALPDISTKLPELAQYIQSLLP